MSLDVDALLGDRGVRIVVCCGSGGVGKTTTAAALALRAAEKHDRRAVVLTIDPARRLAQSLGLTELSNTPRTVTQTTGGQLDAMMLDMKRTFDEVVLSHTSEEKAAEIFANPFYQAMSSTFSGTQEYMAMEKLAQLRAADSWDLIVVDTPPSRSALDFLDAPQRLARFLDGKMLRLLLAPARGGRSVFSVMTAATSFFTNTIAKILGARLLTDIGTFVSSLDSTFGGFRSRAEQTYKVLQDRETAFLVVATPEPDAVREAAYFAGRLTEERMPLAGLILNRVHATGVEGLSAQRSLGAAEGLEEHGLSPVTAGVLRIHADLVAQAEREERVAARFITAHPDVPTTRVAAQPGDVHDLTALRNIGDLLAEDSPA